MHTIELSNLLNNATVGAVSGAFTGAITGTVAASALKSLSRRRLKQLLSLEPQQKRGHRTCALIRNGHSTPLTSVYAYITIENDPKDIIEPPPGYSAYLKPSHPSKVVEDRLCWSIAGNPPCIDIAPEENQSLDIVEISSDSNWLRIPSESGWEMCRVFLIKKTYDATIKIVSRDIKAKSFRITIDPFDRSHPVSLRRK